MRRVKIIGAGQLGSRHLQALHGVREPLEIHVVDPQPGALAIAKQRYESVGTDTRHKVSFGTEIEKTGSTDVAVVATNSAYRRRAIEDLLGASSVKFLVLEKLLFDRQADYAKIEALLGTAGVQAWVNCPMRVMPTYCRIAGDFGQKPVSYRVTGAQYGLVTNAIHYLDHVVCLTGCEHFEIDTSRLVCPAIYSKREGFLEFNGTLSARFSDGSFCEMVCYANGSAPVVVEIFSDSRRFIVRESEGKLWQCNENSRWVWQELDAPIPYQSQMTTWIIESLLSDGKCGLTPFAVSSRIHLNLLNALRERMGETGPASPDYPFT